MPAVRGMIEQLQLEQIAAQCSAATQCDEGTARDALLDVLSALWCKRDEYRSAFQSQAALVQYLRISTIRHIIRYHGTHKRHLPLHAEDHLDARLTPEEQVLAMLSAQRGEAWIEQACGGLSARDASAVRELIQLVLDAPETYIKTRQSGEMTGQYVFYYGRIADALGWSRRHVRKRLEQLRRALQTHQRTHFGEAP